MRIKVNGTREDYALHLGVQTTPDLVKQDAHRLAKTWAPTRARSYRLTITDTDYHGTPADAVTGYASVRVEYFTRADEGTHRVGDGKATTRTK